MALSVWIQKKLGAFRLDVRFETDGTPLGILGASGCGKSVTLNCIAGVMKPDAGRIVLNGHVLFDSEHRINLPPQKRGVGYLFQQYALFPNMTVRQNILAGVRTGTRTEKRARAEEALERFRLTDAADQYPGALSGGQQQRTALARIMVGDPELLLLDEPFSALDSYLREQLMWEMTRSLSDYAGDVLLVSHNRDEVRRFCPSACVMDAGYAEPVRPTETLLHSPETVAAARLAGYANIAPFTRIDARTIACPKWNLTLQSEEMPDAKMLCIPEDAFTGAQPGEAGAFFGTVVGKVRREDGPLLLIRPVGAAEDAVLLMRDFVCDAKTDGTVCTRVTEKRLIFLKNSGFS